MEKNHKQKNPKKSKYSGLEKYGKFSGMAFQMIAVILAFVWAGIKLDGKFREGRPLFIIIFAIFGVFLSLYIALKDFIKFK